MVGRIVGVADTIAEEVGRIVGVADTIAEEVGNSAAAAVDTMAAADTMAPPQGREPSLERTASQM